MNIGQYEKYFQNAWNEVSDALRGKKYRDIQAAGDFAATVATNYMQQAESEKAYKRSLPTTQVSNLMQAGMSRAGALNTINGGGSYTPAPMQAATPGTAATNVLQTDLATANAVIDGVSNLAQTTASITQNAQMLKERKREFNKTLALEERKVDIEETRLAEESMQNAALRNLWHEQSEYQKQVKEYQSLQNEILKAVKDNKISYENQQYIANKSRALLDDLNSRLLKVGYENMNSETLSSLMNLKAQLELLGHIGDMSMAKVIDLFHDVKNTIFNWL